MSWHDRLRRHVYWTCAIAEAGDLDRTGALALVWDELLSLGPYEHAPRRAWLGLVRSYDQHRTQWRQWPPEGLARQYGAEPDGLRALIEGGRVATRKKTFAERVQDDIDAAHAAPPFDRGESVGGVSGDSPPNPAETPPTPPANPRNDGRFLIVPIGALRTNPNNPRADAGAVEDLARSVDELGILQPLVVRPDGAGAYEVVAGNRRLEAARLVGLDVVPVVVRDLDPIEALEVSVTENSARLDVSPVDDAHAVYQLARRGRDVAQIARVVGRSAGWVRTRLAIARAEPEVQALLRSGGCGVGEAAQVSSLDPDEQRAWAAKDRPYAVVLDRDRKLADAPWDPAADTWRGIVWSRVEDVTSPTCVECPRRMQAAVQLELGEEGHLSPPADDMCMGGRCWRARIDAIAERAPHTGRTLPATFSYTWQLRDRGVRPVVVEGAKLAYDADEVRREMEAGGRLEGLPEYVKSEVRWATPTPEELAERDRRAELARQERAEEAARREEARKAARDWREQEHAPPTPRPTLTSDETTAAAASSGAGREEWRGPTSAPSVTPAPPPEPVRDEQGRVLVIVDRHGVLAALVERFRELDLEQPGAMWAAAMLEDALAKCERCYDL